MPKTTTLDVVLEQARKLSPLDKLHLIERVAPDLETALGHRDLARSGASWTWARTWVRRHRRKTSMRPGGKPGVASPGPRAHDPRGRRHAQRDLLPLFVKELVGSDSLLVEAPVDRHVMAAMRELDRASVPDLPNRVIAATGHRLGVPVTTKVSAITGSVVEALW